MTRTTHAEIEHTITLIKTDQKRLERFVLRDGFAVCEEDVAEIIAADREFTQGQSVSHESVMRAAE